VKKLTKEQFLKKLDELLIKIPNEEREDIIRDFEEHFLIGAEEGKSDTEIIAALGSPQHIAKELMATYHIGQVESNVSAGNIVRAVWAVIGLSFFNLIIVLGPFIAVVAIIFAGWVTSISFVASPLLFVFNTIIYPQYFIAFDLFFSIGLCGLGIFIGVGMYYVTRLVIYGTVRYLKYNVNLAKGGLK